MNLATTRRLRRRSPFRLYKWWDRYSPLIVHGPLALGILALILQGSAHGLAWIVLIHQLLRSADAFLPDREAESALLAEEDFLQRERARVDKRLRRERAALVTSLLLAAGLVWLSRVHAEHAEALLLGALVWASLVLLRCALLMPELRRELDELGGKPGQGGWLSAFLFSLLGLVYLLLLPLLLLYHGIRSLLPGKREDEE